MIPVAALRFGLGGGSGSDSAKRQEGEGAGAGGTMTPIGYIEIKDGRTRFVPIVHPARMAALFCLALLAALLLMHPPAASRHPRGRRRH